MKIRSVISAAILAVFASTGDNAHASNLFIYRSPSGERIVTDRPINLPGYQLEKNNLNASSAGNTLRYQDNTSNRALINRHIRGAAALYNIDSALITAIIRQESAFRIDAKSHKGAMGLMQLMPATAKQYRVRNILDPRENIYAGTKHMRYLLGRYQNISLALAAYNAGENAVSKYQGIPPYPETQDYVKKVLTWYREYKGQ